jgi:hypothetical protein
MYVADVATTATLIYFHLLAVWLISSPLADMPHLICPFVLDRFQCVNHVEQGLSLGLFCTSVWYWIWLDASATLLGVIFL